jgi:hypothetical protein
MSEKLLSLAGTWKGTNRLYVPWMTEKIKESDSTAAVRSKMNGQFLSIEYTWSFDGDLQEGLLILGCDAKSDAVQAVWTDSWHSKNVLMLCNGNVNKDGSISDFVVLKGLGREADLQAVGIVSTMPNWTPGTLNGEPVRAKVVLPIKFRSDTQLHENVSSMG